MHRKNLSLNSSFDKLKALTQIESALSAIPQDTLIGMAYSRGASKDIHGTIKTILSDYKDNKDAVREVVGEETLSLILKISNNA